VHTLPAQAYHDPDVYARERTAIFGRQWQLAGFRAHLRDPGDVVTHTFASWPVLVIVQDDGSLAAFYNICRHRAGPLVVEDATHCANLVCRYHGWSYDRDGSLRSARDFGEAVDFDPTEYGLWPIRVAEWRGCVFVNLDRDASSLEADLGGFFAELDDQPLETWSYSHRVVNELAANWKTYVDNYMEGYHLPLVHPRLTREVVAKEYRVDVGDHYCMHSVPTRDGAVNAGTWLWRFPTLAINTYPAGMDVERIVPVSPTRTLVVYDYFFADLSPAATAANDAVVRMSCELLDEDRRICELVQRNLETGVYDTGRLSPRHEHGVHAFQDWVRKAMQ
jgi:choline monooxygenase